MRSKGMMTISIWWVVGIIGLTSIGFAASEEVVGSISGDTQQSVGYRYESTGRRNPFRPEPE